MKTLRLVVPLAVVVLRFRGRLPGWLGPEMLHHDRE